MSPSPAKNLCDLDPFSREVASVAMEKWNEAQPDIGASTGRIPRYTRLGWMVSNFTDAELYVLSDIGFLSELDRLDLASAGRAFTYASLRPFEGLS